MAWWRLGRWASRGGRHALGAAVTAIPSGPLVLPGAVSPSPVTESSLDLLESLLSRGLKADDAPAPGAWGRGPAEPETVGLAELFAEEPHDVLAEQGAPAQADVPGEAQQTSAAAFGVGASDAAAEPHAAAAPDPVVAPDAVVVPDPVVAPDAVVVPDTGVELDPVVAPGATPGFVVTDVPESCVLDAPAVLPTGPAPRADEVVWPLDVPDLLPPPPAGGAAAALAAAIAEQMALNAAPRPLPQPDALLEAAKALVLAEEAPEPVVALPPLVPAPFVPDQPPLLDPALLQVPAQVAREPRVRLGFRDGSTTSLQPDSEQAKALEELARLMTS